jgi:hypothetical protein
VRPLLKGQSGSPLMLAIFPLVTLTRMPHVPPHSRLQNVLMTSVTFLLPFRSHVQNRALSQIRVGTTGHRLPESRRCRYAKASSRPTHRGYSHDRDRLSSLTICPSSAVRKKVDPVGYILSQHGPGGNRMLLIMPRSGSKPPPVQGSVVTRRFPSHHLRPAPALTMRLNWPRRWAISNPQPIFLTVTVSERHSQTSEFLENSEVFFNRFPRNALETLLVVY